VQEKLEAQEKDIKDIQKTVTGLLKKCEGSMANISMPCSKDELEKSLKDNLKTTTNLIAKFETIKKNSLKAEMVNVETSAAAFETLKGQCKKSVDILEYRNQNVKASKTNQNHESYAVRKDRRCFLCDAYRNNGPPSMDCQRSRQRLSFMLYFVSRCAAAQIRRRART